MDIVYYRDRAGITSDFMTEHEARDLFATRECKGDLSGGFTYWGAVVDGVGLVHTLVTPWPIEAIPPLARLALEERFQAQVEALASPRVIVTATAENVQ